MTRSGAALHEAGNDLDQAVALGVAMNSVTQNAESTGQTLKTVSMYLRAAKTDLTAMGESTDGCANSVSELRSELKKLTGVDIIEYLKNHVQQRSHGLFDFFHPTISPSIVFTSMLLTKKALQS